MLRELTNEEIEAVSGGIVPIIALAAVAATTVTFGFTIGIFDGIRAKYSRQAS